MENAVRFQIESIVRLAPLFPLLGFVINGLLNKKLQEKVIGWIGSGGVFISFILSVWAFILLIILPPEARSIQASWFTWIISGSFSTSISFLYDPLSAVMMFVVTGVGFLIHVYSIGYMRRDGAFRRYFAYLNLFTFAMLRLVLADNFLLLSLGWEGVGLCTYLLIGFWFEKQSAADAGKKAFIVNRIGDFRFSLGIILIFWTFYQARDLTVNLLEVSHLAPKCSGRHRMTTAICLLLFLGAAGKSAQIPLHVWLPDAMEGPTPVSALIHAATMVTAGVYMLSRHGVVYVGAGFDVRGGSVGAVTAIFAATIGAGTKRYKEGAGLFDRESTWIHVPGLRCRGFTPRGSFIS